MVEHSERAGDIVQGPQAGPAMAALREFMFERVYLGPAVRAEHAKIAAVVRRLFEHYVEHPELLPRARTARHRARTCSWRERVTDYLAGMTDRYCIRAVHRAAGAAGVRPLALPAWRSTPTSPRTACATRSTSSSWSPRAPSCAAPGPARYEGLCPFHDERTPSFGIDPAQKVYYCFGCQASGDVFTFVQETEGVDFKGALELLAERYGVELQREEEDPREAERRKRRERLLELLDRTAAYYERYLWESEEAARAREYLQGRGLGEEILREFRVGYAPSAWDRVLLASRRGGFSEQELYDDGPGAALEGERPARTTASARGSCSRWRTSAGGCSGFGARAMREEQRPKYLNTSDNDVYHKGLHLYGADLARAHATQAGEVILCEGYTDVIALHQAGMRNAVGLMGTALTGEQVGELARMAQTVLLALDADSAGQEAMLRASGWRRSASWSCAWCRCRRARTRRS